MVMIGTMMAFMPVGKRIEFLQRHRQTEVTSTTEKK